MIQKESSIKTIVAALLGCISINNAMAQPPYDYQATVTNVVDGDTVDAVIDLGFKVTTTQRLRLARVDTPERHQAGWSEAKNFTDNFLKGKQVIVRTTKVSKFGYYLAEIYADGQNISDALIKSKHGRYYDGGTKEAW
jgi:micrococcal nuclease